MIQEIKKIVAREGKILGIGLCIYIVGIIIIPILGIVFPIKAAPGDYYGFYGKLLLGWGLLGPLAFVFGYPAYLLVRFIFSMTPSLKRSETYNVKYHRIAAIAFFIAILLEFLLVPTYKSISPVKQRISYLDSVITSISTKNFGELHIYLEKQRKRPMGPDLSVERLMKENNYTGLLKEFSGRRDLAKFVLDRNLNEIRTMNIAVLISIIIGVIAIMSSRRLKGR